MTLEELALLNELFSSRFGLYFPEHKREILENRLLPRLRSNHVQRFLDYYLLLQYDLEKELDPLIRAITNNESYFFRETGQFKALSDETLDQLRDGGKNPGGLNFLSAGCSSGEEAYTLNIFVRGRTLGSLNIHAVDIDTERLELARRAVYRPTALRVLSEQQIDQYFERLDDTSFELRRRFRVGVSFHHGNLLDLETLTFEAPYDAIFCRNVLIYFSEPALKSTIDHFAELIRPGGLLFLGHSESIIGLTQAFRAERLGDCIAYRRLEDRDGGR